MHEISFRRAALILTALAAGQAIHAAAQQTPAQAGWGHRAAMVEPISEQAVVEMNGKIYAVAGITAAGETVALVQVYDSAKDAWSLTKPLPQAVNHHMAAVVSGKIYVFGGQSASPTTSPFVDSVYEYNPATEQWSARAAMPTARSAGATAVINGKIYVAGGRPPRGHDFAVYDPAADKWTTLPDLPTQRNHLAVAAMQGKVYVVGGRFDAGAASPITNLVEIYDPATRKWSTGAEMLLARGGINGIVANGCLHIFGGEGNRSAPNGMFPGHDVYNPATNSWTRLADMPIPVHGVTGAAFLNGLIHLPGGATGQGGAGRSAMLQVYRPAMTCN